MVRIPLIRRQPKPDSSQAEDDKSKGKDHKSKDRSRVEQDLPVAPPTAADGKQSSSSPAPATRAGLQPQQPENPAGGKTALPETDPQAAQFVLGTDKKIPLPRKPPGYDALREHNATAGTVAAAERLSDWQEEKRPDVTSVSGQPAERKAAVEVHEVRPASVTPLVSDEGRNAEGAVAVYKPRLPESKPEEEIAQGSESAGFEKRSLFTVPPDGSAAVRPPEAASPQKAASSSPSPQAGGQTGLLPGAETGNALAMLQAVPDYLFRIGSKGVLPVLSNGSLTGADLACGVAGRSVSSGSATASEEDEKSKLLRQAILEELTRQNEQHTKKALETGKLQTFEFQVRTDKEARDLEVRLTPFGQGEVLALVRDVTLQKQTHNALIESRNELENHLKERNAELIRVNKMLKAEVDLGGEQEEILKKSFRRLERLLDDTIGAITLIVEERDPHIANHQRRVSQLAFAIGQEMKLRNDQMRAVRMAGQLHDLGKIFIPAEILRKPGKLTAAEISVVKTHPDTDYRILKRIDFPISIADVVRQHHERMDGSGYPQGLKGDSILVEARILAVADTVEGMVFERPYRVAPGLEAALKEIADHKGTLYDSTVVDACLKLFAEESFRFEPTPGGENAGKGGQGQVPTATPCP